MMTDKCIYLFTDIEADGPLPGKNSMISLASVARGDEGEEFGEFEANLSPLSGASQCPETMAWWKTQPEAWEYSITNPQDPVQVMQDFAVWIEQLPGTPVLAAHPVRFDFMWVTWYLQHFVGRAVLQGPALDIETYAMATLDWGILDSNRRNWPEEWLGGFAHNHKAIDDAKGYANAFFELRRLNSKLGRSEVQLAHCNQS